MSLAGFVRKLFVPSVSARLAVRPLACARVSTMKMSVTHAEMQQNHSEKRNAREMDITFLLTLFQSLHSRNLMDVMNETLAQYSLTKEQTMEILKSDMFIQLHELVVMALLQNKSIIRDNVAPEELWEVLKKWSMNNVETRPARAPSPFRIGSDPSREWLEVQKIFLPFIDFEQMDAKYFIDNIESIPDSYHMLTRDRKYRIMRQHTLNLLQEREQRDKRDQEQEEVRRQAAFNQIDSASNGVIHVLEGELSANIIEPAQLIESSESVDSVASIESIESAATETLPLQETDEYGHGPMRYHDEEDSYRRLDRQDRDLYGQPLAY